MLFSFNIDINSLLVRYRFQSLKWIPIGCTGWEMPKEMITVVHPSEQEVVAVVIAAMMQRASDQMIEVEEEIREAVETTHDQIHRLHPLTATMGMRKVCLYMLIRTLISSLLSETVYHTTNPNPNPHPTPRHPKSHEAASIGPFQNVPVYTKNWKRNIPPKTMDI